MKPKKPPIPKSEAKTPTPRKSDNAALLDSDSEQELQARIEKLQTENSKLLSDNSQLQRIFDSVPEFITVIDNEHRVVRINKAMAERLGCEVQQCVGRRCYEIVHGMQAPPASCPHLRTLADGAEHRQEIHEPKIDGDFLITTTPLLDERGEKVGSVHLAHDITAQKQIEEQTRRLASFPQLNPNPVIEIDSHGKNIFINPAAERILSDLGMKREDAAVFLPADMHDISEALRTQEETALYREVRIKDRFFSATIQLLPRFNAVRIYAFEITNRKKAEEALKESEQRVRHKLQSLLSPEGDIATLELGDIIDAPSIQLLMDEFYKLTHIPMAIIDLKGKVLVGIGWQDICTKFHRVKPETCAYCIESDTLLTADVAPGEYKIYKCKNNMWDVATPIEVGQRRLGHFFTGQFFFADESPDYEFFRAQARQYGFPEEEYLAALERVPRLSREDVKSAMSFFMSLSVMISRLSYSNVKLARILVERDRLTASLRESETRLKRAQEIAHLGSWELDLAQDRLTWSDEVYRIFGLQPQEFAATYEAFVDRIHPDDRAAVDAAYSGSIRENKNSYEIEHRIIRKSDGVTRIVHEKCEHFRDEHGKISRSVGMVHDISERKKAEDEIRQNLQELERLNRAMVGRELRMVELKKEVNELLAQAGSGPRYRLEFERE